MDEYYVWMTTRRIKPGMRTAFERAWRPAEFPEGMLRAYELWSDDGEEIVGLSIWSSRQLCERYRSSEVEARRGEAMAPYVLEARTSTYDGRELTIPGR